MPTIRQYHRLAAGMLALMLYLLAVNVQATPGRIYTKPIHKDPPYPIQCLLAPRTRPCDVI